MSKWSQQEALDLCAELEKLAPQYGGHIALTGGLLYKSGRRKDLDIVVYRIRQIEAFDWDGFFFSLDLVLDIKRGSDTGWCKKATMDGRNIDFFDPDAVEYADSPTAGSTPT